MGTFQRGAHCFNSPLKWDVPLYEVCNWVILVFEIVTHVGRESENSGIVFALSLTSSCIRRLVSGTRSSECFGGGRKLLHHQLPRSASEDDRISRSVIDRNKNKEKPESSQSKITKVLHTQTSHSEVAQRTFKSKLLFLADNWYHFGCVITYTSKKRHCNDVAWRYRLRHY